jgi:hypothetical protein
MAARRLVPRLAKASASAKASIAFRLCAFRWILNTDSG